MMKWSSKNRCIVSCQDLKENSPPQQRPQTIDDAADDEGVDDDVLTHRMRSTETGDCGLLIDRIVSRCQSMSRRHCSSQQHLNDLRKLVLQCPLIADRYRLMEDQMTALGFDRDPFVVVAAVGESLAYVGRYVQCVRVLRSAMHLAAAATCSRCSRPCSPRNDNANYCCGPPTSGRIGSSSSPLSSASASSPIAGDSGTESSSPLPSLIQAVKCNHLPVEEAAVGCSARYLVIDWTLSCLVLAYWTLGDREQAVQFARRRLTVAELRADLRTQAIVCANLSAMCYHRHDYKLASLYRQAHRLLLLRGANNDQVPRCGPISGTGQ